MGKVLVDPDDECLHIVRDGVCTVCQQGVRKNGRIVRCFHRFWGKVGERRCQVCGFLEPVSPPGQGKSRGPGKAKRRRALLETHGERCYYCGVPTIIDFEHNHKRRQSGRECTIDHIIPIVKGGTHELSNIVIACFWCNNVKGDGTEEELRAKKGFIERCTWVNKNF